MFNGVHMLIHQSLEGGWCSIESKGHHIELVETKRSCTGCLFLGLFRHWHLPVAPHTHQVKGGYILGWPYLQDVFDSGHRIGIKLCHLVELAVVDTEADTAVLFLD